MRSLKQRMDVLEKAQTDSRLTPKQRAQAKKLLTQGSQLGKRMDGFMQKKTSSTSADKDAFKETVIRDKAKNREQGTADSTSDTNEESCPPYFTEKKSETDFAKEEEAKAFVASFHLTGQCSANSSLYDDEDWFSKKFTREIHMNTPVLPAESEETRAKDPGLIYLFVHQSNGAVKIGLTRKNADVRMKDYIKKNKLAGNWEMVRTWEVSDVRAIEKAIHKELFDFRISNKAREVFCCSVDEAMDVIESVVYE